MDRSSEFAGRSAFVTGTGIGAAVARKPASRVRACVAVGFVSEFGCYLEVPLLAPR